MEFFFLTSRSLSEFYIIILNLITSDFFRLLHYATLISGNFHMNYSDTRRLSFFGAHFFLKRMFEIHTGELLTRENGQVKRLV